MAMPANDNVDAPDRICKCFVRIEANVAENNNEIDVLFLEFRDVLSHHLNRVQHPESFDVIPHCKDGKAWNNQTNNPNRRIPKCLYQIGFLEVSPASFVKDVRGQDGEPCKTQVFLEVFQ